MALSILPRRLRRADIPPTVHQVSVTGRVFDAINGAELTADLALLWRVQGSGTALRPFPGWLKRAADGRFAFALRPAQLPLVNAGDTIELRLEARLPTRAPEIRETTVPGSALQPAPGTAATSGGEIGWQGLAAPLWDIDVVVPPRPVTLEGTVLLDHDPTTPAVGTQVSILDPAATATATADARGFFRLALPVAAIVTLRLVHPQATAEVEVRPDHAARVNRLPLSLDT